MIACAGAVATALASIVYIVDQKCPFAKPSSWLDSTPTQQWHSHSSSHSCFSSEFDWEITLSSPEINAPKLNLTPSFCLAINMSLSSHGFNIAHLMIEIQYLSPYFIRTEAEPGERGIHWHAQAPPLFALRYAMPFSSHSALSVILRK